MVGFALLALLFSLATAAVLAWPLRRTRTAFAGLMVAIPVLALSLYLLVGVPNALDPAQRNAPQTLEEAVAQLQASLERDPRQAEGWRLLGRALLEQRRFGEARDAFAQAARLDPEDTGLQVEYAEARSRAHPQRLFDQEALALLERVVAEDPAQERARLFLGIAYRQAGRDAEAAQAWEPLLAELGADARAGLRAQIDAAREAAGLPPLEPGAEAEPEAGAHDLRVRVSLDPDDAARVRLDPDAALFVLARVPDGPPMPVAVQRRRVAELPLELVLRDGDSPMPTQTLSALQEVEVVARISASGTATPQEGDLASPPVRVRLPADGTVELVLDASP